MAFLVWHEFLIFVFEGKFTKLNKISTVQKSNVALWFRHKSNPIWCWLQASSEIDFQNGCRLKQQDCACALHRPFSTLRKMVVSFWVNLKICTEKKLIVTDVTMLLTKISIAMLVLQDGGWLNCRPPNSKRIWIEYKSDGRAVDHETDKSSTPTLLPLHNFN